jgi:hypothetical protein
VQHDQTQTGEHVLGLVERCGGHSGTLTEVFDDPFGDGPVHAVGIDFPHVRFGLLVAVLTPYEDTDGVGV